MVWCLDTMALVATVLWIYPSGFNCYRFFNLDWIGEHCWYQTVTKPHNLVAVRMVHVMWHGMVLFCLVISFSTLVKQSGLVPATIICLSNKTRYLFSQHTSYLRLHHGLSKSRILRWCANCSSTWLKHHNNWYRDAVSIRKTVLPGMAIPMLKIRRPNGRLIFNMEIAIRR